MKVLSNEIGVLVAAGVAKTGQRRRAQDPVPQGFVGSNPTPRTKRARIRAVVKFGSHNYQAAIARHPVAKSVTKKGFFLVGVHEDDFC